MEATLGVTELVEAMHRTISTVPGPLGTPPTGRTRGTTGFVYGSVRGVTRLVGSGLDVALGQLAPLLRDAPPSAGRDLVLAALNGVLGDHLEATGNSLATAMRFRRNGLPLELEPGALAASIPGVSSRVVLLLHGLCMNESSFTREGHDHGTALERDLGLTPVYLRYNTGRHVSTNGRELAGLLEKLVASWPVPLTELSVVAHSMGGLVIRSAINRAAALGQAWPERLRSIVFLGTPHHGSPLERGGSFVDAALGVSPYSLPFTHLGKVRSAGITDLRHGNVLDDDWAGHDRFAPGGDRRTPVPLPTGIACFAVAATKARKSGGVGDRMMGDGLVPVASALGHHRDPERTLDFQPARTWIARGMNHFDLLSKPEVYERIRDWLQAP